MWGEWLLVQVQAHAYAFALLYGMRSTRGVCEAVLGLVVHALLAYYCVLVLLIKCGIILVLLCIELVCDGLVLVLLCIELVCDWLDACVAFYIERVAHLVGIFV